MIEKDTIKGLECCTDEWYENCNECPYSIDTVSCERMKLLEDSLDLINHKQELLEAAIAGQETLQKALADKDKEIECITAEKEQLIKTFGECQAEAIKEFAKEIRAEINEAIKSNQQAKKQRIDRLTEKGIVCNDNFCSYCDGKIHALCGIGEFIDNPVKEEENLKRSDNNA